MQNTPFNPNSGPASLGGIAPDPTQVNQNATPAAQPTDSGNWFTHLLPTIGGIGGSILGGIATAGLGGEVIGGAGGSALGQGIENMMEGKQAIQGNDLTAGLEGGIGTGIGGVIGKGLGAVGKLASGAAKGLTDRAAQDAAQAATRNGVTDLATEYKDVAPAKQILYGGKATTDHVSGLGMQPTADNLAAVGQNTNDHLNGVLNKALAQSGPVDMSNYSQLIKEAIAKADPNGNILGDYSKTLVRPGKLGANSEAAKTLDLLESLGAGTNKTNADPLEVRALTTRLYNAAKDAQPTSVNSVTGAIDPEQLAKYHAISNARDAVKNSLYNRDEVNSVLTPLQGNLQAGDTLGNQQLADHINGIVSGAGNNGSTTAAQDLLNEIRRNINVENFGQEGQKVKQIITSRGGQDRLLAEQGIPAGQAQAVDPASGAPLNVVSDVAQAKGLTGKGLVLAKHAVVNPKMLGTLGRIGALSDKLGTVGGKVEDGIQTGGRPLPGLADMAGTAIGLSPTLGAGPAPVDTTGLNGVAGVGDGTMNPTMQSANPQQQTLDAMRAQSILAPFMAGQSGATSYLSQIQPTLQKNSLAESAIAGLPQAYANAGGAQGPTGILSQISSLIPGTAANTYEKAKATAAGNLAASLGISQDQAAALLPQLMQNQQSAHVSQGILGNLSGNLIH